MRWHRILIAVLLIMVTSVACDITIEEPIKTDVSVWLERERRPDGTLGPILVAKRFVLDETPTDAEQIEFGHCRVTVTSPSEFDLAAFEKVEVFLMPRSGDWHDESTFVPAAIADDFADGSKTASFRVIDVDGEVDDFILDGNRVGLVFKATPWPTAIVPRGDVELAFDVRIDITL